MNATQRGRRSDALYYDNQHVNKRSLCDMVAQRESDIEDLKALVTDMHAYILAVDAAGAVNEGEDGAGVLCVSEFEQRMRALGVRADD